jgi:hypothetical protein
MLIDKILIDGKFSGRTNENYIKKNYKEDWDRINEFSLLYGYDKLKWIIKIYNFLFDIKEIPKCFCGKNVNFKGNINQIYHIFCSKKCSTTSTAKKRMDTLKVNNNKKYGVNNVFELDNVKEKIKKTNLENYGFVYANQSNEVKNKIKKTNLERYGFGCCLLNDNTKIKTKKTNLDKYGFEYCFKNKNIQNKIKITNLERYGVEYVSQNVDIHNKIMLSGYKIKKFKDTNLYYQGTYELDFLNKYYDKLKIKRGETIMYEFNGELKAYHPDFYIEDYGLLVEIKSDYIWNKHLEENLAKVKHLEEKKIKYIIIMNKNYDEFIKKINL